MKFRVPGSGFRVSGLFEFCAFKGTVFQILYEITDFIPQSLCPFKEFVKFDLVDVFRIKSTITL